MNIPAWKIIIGLLILMVIIAGLGFSDNPTTFLGLMLLIVGGLAFCISHIILGMAAFAQDMTTGLLFVFVPLYDVIFAFNQYHGDHKVAIIVSWFGGALLAVIGSFILIFWGLF